jgi:hypothetical protein
VVEAAPGRPANAAVSEHRAAEGVEAQLLLHHGGEAVHPLPEVDRPGREEDPKRPAGKLRPVGNNAGRTSRSTILVRRTLLARTATARLTRPAPRSSGRSWMPHTAFHSRRAMTAPPRRRPSSTRWAVSAGHLLPTGQPPEQGLHRLLGIAPRRCLGRAATWLRAHPVQSDRRQGARLGIREAAGNLRVVRQCWRSSG